MIQIQGVQQHLVVAGNVGGSHLLSGLDVAVGYCLASVFKRSSTQPAVLVDEDLVNTQFVSLSDGAVLETSVIDHECLIALRDDRVVTLRALRVVASSHKAPIAIGSEDVLATVGLTSTVRTVVDTILIIDGYCTCMIGVGIRAVRIL